MAGLIPQWFIDDLLNRVDIVDLIDVRVPLKKAGHEFKACCPFHNEKTPSFTVSPAKQFYHCFGCGAHGSALGFLMEYEHMDYVEAIETLAALQGMEVPRETSNKSATHPQKREQDNNARDLLQQISDYYQQQLKHSDAAINYLKQRGLTGEIAAEYALGFAPPGWNNLQQLLGTEQKLLLLSTGMLIEKDNHQTYDRFRERIMFPIRDHRGDVIGFGGRVIGTADGAKYTNSPETAIFHKGRELYGLYEARKNTRQLDKLLVVEGYMDVIALAQHGIGNVVATLGTATTGEHFKQLFRVVCEIIFCFDGDRAGRDAAWRALENALPHMRDGRIIRFLFLPEGEDPDSMAQKHGITSIEREINRSLTLSQFFFQRLSNGLDLDHADDRSRLAQLAQPLLKTLPGGVFHEIMLEQLADATGLSTDKLVSVTALDQEPAITRKPVPRPGRSTPEGKLVRHLITLLLNMPELAMQISNYDYITNSGLPGTALLAELIGYIQDNPGAHPGQILEHWRDTEYFTALDKLAQISIEHLGEHQLEPEFQGTLKTLRGKIPSEADKLRQRLTHGGESLKSLSDEDKQKLRDDVITR